MVEKVENSGQKNEGSNYFEEAIVVTKEIIISYSFIPLIVDGVLDFSCHEMMKFVTSSLFCHKRLPHR